VDLSTVTTADFRALFPRDFPYLPEYSAGQLYNAGNKVYYSTALLFYSCTVNGTIGVAPNATPTPPAVSPWIIVPDNIDNYVQDSDITRAFAEAQVNLNQALFSTDAQIKLGYLYLTAHYLVNDLRAALGGISASALFPALSRTVGSVTESYMIPDVYKDNPVFSFYTTTPYGLKYLSLILPQLVGNFGAVCGWTHP
jgi:hypothetical protein